MGSCGNNYNMKLNVREAKNFGLNKLNFENIRENQRKVVEAYLSGRDVLMISPTGSGKSLTFHIAPFAIDLPLSLTLSLSPL